MVLTVVLLAAALVLAVATVLRLAYRQIEVVDVALLRARAMRAP